MQKISSLFALLIFNFIFLATSGQNVGPTYGTVKDIVTKKTIAGATVQIKDSYSAPEKTNKKGGFSSPIYNAPATLIISAKGYITKYIKVADVEQNLGDIILQRIKKDGRKN